MSSFDFSPMITKLGYYSSVNTSPNEEITDVVNIESLENILLYFRVSGLNFTYPPVEYFGDSEVDIYINVTLFNVRGGKDTYFKNSSLHINKDLMSIDKNYVEIMTSVMPDKGFSFDGVETVLKCIIFFSSEEITNEDKVFEYIRESTYILYQSKIPVVGGTPNGK